jgi:hypothetical protein
LRKNLRDLAFGQACPDAPRAPQLEAAREVHLHLHGLTPDEITAVTRVIRLDGKDVQ